jgi:DNA-binding transcriptional regulator YiaG
LFLLLRTISFHSFQNADYITFYLILQSLSNVIIITITITIMMSDNNDNNDFYCQAAPTLLPYQPAFSATNAFRSIPAIDFSHLGSPRFGNTDDISALVGSKEEQVAYLKGAVAGAICIFVLFLVWVCVLVYFKIRGPTKYGWLSGSRTLLPPKEGEDEDQTTNVEMLKKEDIEETPSSFVDDADANMIHHKEEDDAEVQQSTDEWDRMYTKQIRQNRRMKGLVFAAAIGIIIVSIMMVSKG